MAATTDEQLGRSDRTPSTRPSPNSAPQSISSTAQRLVMAQAARQLFAFCEMPEIGDPKAFMAAVVAIFEQFPNEVVRQVVDPARGIPSKHRRPALVDIRKACDDAYAPIDRANARAR